MAKANGEAEVRIRKAAEEAGTDALVVSNTVLAMQIDINTFKPSLGNIMGGLSGPAIKPIVLRMVYQCNKIVSIPIIGCGGIASAEDAIEFIIAGATAVQVGTATFINPLTMVSVISDFEIYCRKKGIERVSDLIGKVNDQNTPDNAALIEVDV